MIVTFKIILFLTIFIFILSLSAVSAHDVNETVDGDGIGDDSTISNMADITIAADDNLDEPGSIKELASEIDNASAGSVMDLSKDYKGDSYSRINLNKDLTIDGHGHALNCNHGSHLFNSEAGNITLKNIIITNGSGAAVHIEGSAVYSIVNCTFVNNHDALRAAIYNDGGNVLTITNCNFTSNHGDNQGGAIYSKGEIHIVNSTFDSNRASVDGGAIYSKGEIHIVNSTFDSNRATVDGGAVYAEHNVFICNTTFQNNRAEGAILSQCYGGAIRSKEVYINNCTFVNNYAADYGGAIFAYNVYINYNLNNSGEFNTFFINNLADDNEGGAIFAVNKINVSDAVFSKNRAYVDGGAIKTDRVISNHCLFDFNHAMGAKCAKSYGGAIRATDADINNSGFINNYAQNRGGAIYTDNFASCINSYFENNIARDYGGAIYACRFNKNVINVSFVNNTAQECDGGAVYVFNECSIGFSQCSFVSNHCGDEGGAIYIDSSKSHLWIVGNCFDGNSASEGQAVYNCGYYNQIQNNFWAGVNPSAGNDQLIEWKAWGSNVHHCDSNPVILGLIFDPHMEDGEFLINVKVAYVTSDGALFTRNFDMVNVTYEVSEDGVSAEIKNVNKEKNSVSFDFKPVFGENTVTIHYKDYTLSKDGNIELSLMFSLILNRYLEKIRLQFIIKIILYQKT